MKKLIDEYKHFDLTATPENWFCFDNESFRYLAQVEKGVIDHANDEIKKQIYAKSWDLTSKETQKLFTKVQNMIPHRIRDTASIHDARRIIMESAIPRAQFTKTIEENYIQIKDTLDELNKTKEHQNDLEKNLWLPGHTAIQKDLGFQPRLVCIECAEEKSVTISHKELGHYKDYVQVCHDPCHCKTDELKFGLHCVTMGGTKKKTAKKYCQKGKCKGKKHGWEQHVQIQHVVELVPKAIFNHDAKDKIDHAQSKAETLENTRGMYETKIKELEEEREKLRQITEKFGIYLKHNCMSAINDAFEPYMRRLIREEQESIKPNQKVIDAMESRLQEFQHEKEVIFKQQDSIDSKDVPKSEDIPEMVQQIFKLPNFGKDIESMYQGLGTLAQNQPRGLVYVNQSKLVKRVSSMLSGIKGLVQEKVTKSKADITALEYPVGSD